MGRVKSILICLAIILFGAEGVYGQGISIACPRYIPEEMYWITISAGTATSTSISDQNTNGMNQKNEFKHGFNAFIYVEYARPRSFDFLTLESGIGYINKGNMVTDFIEYGPNGEPLGSSIDYISNYHYIQIPLILNHWLYSSIGLDAEIFVGGYASYLVSISASGNDNLEALEDNLNNSVINRMDYGVTGGLKYILFSGVGKSLGVMYSYQLGFHDPLSNNSLNSTHLINLFYKSYLY